MYIFHNELDKDCFQDVMGYGEYKDFISGQHFWNKNLQILPYTQEERLVMWFLISNNWTLNYIT